MEAKRMNAVEIEEALSELASEPFDKDEFPFALVTRCVTSKLWKRGARQRQPDFLGNNLSL
jgi:hypothetical protein